MRLLIVDDQAKRYGRLIDALDLLGIKRLDIEIVSSVNDARSCLERQRYDLLMLDILIPLWPESEPDVRHSIDFLVELHEGDVMHKPERILGITADRNVAEDVSAKFNEWTWVVVQYSESNDEWINKTVNCVKYILSSSIGSSSDAPTYQLDLAVICALEKPELEEVLKLPWNWSSARPIDDVTFVHDGWFLTEDRRVSVCATFAPRMGMVSTALRSATIITLLRPRLIAMCGICAGVTGKVNFGDVLLADPAWDFQSGKRVRDKDNTQFSIAPHQLHTHAKIRSHVEQIRGDAGSMAQIAANFPGDNVSHIPKVVIGPVASGSAVLADGEVVKEIKAQHRELVGVEMEIYGMYAAAYSASSPQPMPFALKAVCDFADPDKGDKHQRYAAYTSANVLRLLMERFASRILA